MVQSGVLSALGIGVALFFGVYQYRERQKENKIRRENKERNQRMKDLSGLLDEIKTEGNKIISAHRDPLSHHDLNAQLSLAIKDIIAMDYENEKEPRISVIVGNDENPIENKEQALAEFKQEERWGNVSLLVGGDEKKYGYFPMTGHIIKMHLIYDNISQISEEYIDILEDFDKELLNDVESILDEIILNLYEEAISNEGKIDINLKDCNDLEIHKRNLFSNMWEYDNIQEDIDELEEILERLEEIRIKIMQTTYS